MFSGHTITLSLFKKPICVLILCTPSSPYTDYRDQSRTVQIMCCLATMNLNYRPEYQRPCLHPTKARVYKARTGVVQVTICFWYLNLWLLLSCQWLVTCHLLWHSYSGIANTKEAQAEMALGTSVWLMMLKAQLPKALFLQTRLTTDLWTNELIRRVMNRV